MINLEGQSTAVFIAQIMQAQRRQVAAEVADFVFSKFQNSKEAYNAGDIYEAILDHFKAYDLAEDIDYPQK